MGGYKTLASSTAFTTSVSQSDFLRERGELGQSRLPPRLVLLLESLQVSTANAPIPPYQTEWHFPRVEQLDEIGARDAEQIRRLLRG